MAATATTETTTTTEKTDETKRSTSAGQTFLVGENVYIRPVEEADAEYGVHWRDSLLPRSPEHVKKWITEEMPKEQRSFTYIIVRKSDDIPVGSMKTHRDDPVTDLNIYVDPLFEPDAATALKIEALGLMLPWLVDEQHRPTVHLDLAGTDGAVIDAVVAMGGRETARFREILRTWGGRTDQVIVEYKNRQWVETLGDPNNVELPRSGTGEPRPVPAKVTLDGDPPQGAIMVGQRVYLRALTEDDGKKVAEWSRQETEAFWDNGRYMRSAVGFNHHIEEAQKEEMQEWIRFAVCLRENDELIGGVGLDNMDYTNNTAETESEISRVEYRGGGYGFEAKHLLLEYAFDRLGLHMVNSWVIFPNTRSAAALRKQGYREAGRANWAIPHKGGFLNMVCFDLLASEWRALSRESAENT